jgi:hypothetical protein
MTQGTTMYLGNTPWAASATYWTNIIKIGEAITATKMKIVKEPMISPSDIILWTMADASKSDDGLNTMTKLRESIINAPWLYRIKYRIVWDTGSWYCYARVYKNGFAFGTLTTLYTASFVDSVESLAFWKWDLIQIYWATNWDDLSVSAIQICWTTVSVTTVS